MKSGVQYVASLVIAISAFGCFNSKVPPQAEEHRFVEEAVRPQQTMTHETPPFHFREVAAESGLVWTARNGEETGEFSILETFGSGCAAVDFDRDSRLDILVGGGGQFGSKHEILPLPIGLFRQIDDWQFANVTASAGVEPIRHYHHGLWAADGDDDGFVDVLITGWDGLQLLHNQGDGTFTDVTDMAGLSDRQWSLAAAWVDLNQDQHLDLFVGHYVDWSFSNDPTCMDTRQSQRMICDPTRFHGLPCLVYLSNGDGTFRTGNEEVGIHGIGKTLGVVAADLNGDNRPDIYAANDTIPNQLYQSEPTGGYHEVGIQTGVALGEGGSADGSMGADFGDIDGDGQPDLWVSNFENQSFALYRNLGREIFIHSSKSFGVTAVGAEAVGFGTIIFDANGDTYPDIFCANGHVSAPNSRQERRQRPYLFWNNQGRQLVEVASQSGDYLQRKHLGRGCAAGDFDRNGTLDVVMTNTNEPMALLRNETPFTNWLMVELIGTISPRSAIGASVIVQTGDRRQWGAVKGGGSYLSTSESVVHFGLGEQPTIDRLEIQWPSGQQTRLDNIRSNQRLRVVESSRRHVSDMLQPH